MYGSIKGTERRVIMLRCTGSELFECAYFIISESARAREADECDMIREANKIILRNSCGVKKTGGERLRMLFCSTAGAAIGAALMLLLGLFL